jgi:pyrroline-5-carboxylate reductase
VIHCGVLGFLGFGNMGGAILHGLIEAQQLSGKHAVVYDPDPVRTRLAQGLGAEVAETPAELAQASDVLLLAVKPQTMEIALREMRPGLKPDQLFISIAAGIPIAWFRERLGAEARIIRVMPNTPAMCHAGAAGIALGEGCTEADAEIACGIFRSVGTAERVREEDLDAVTALSGSGPAYFFYMVECLVQAGVAQGLPEDVAERLASQTLVGAGRLMGVTGESAAILRARVTSKGGTTEAALRQLRADGLEKVVEEAVAAAAARSRELGQSS